MKDIKIGNYILKIYKNEWKQLYGRIFDTNGNPVNEQGKSLQWSMGQKWIYPTTFDLTVKDLEESFATWLFNMGKLPKTNKYYKRWK